MPPGVEIVSRRVAAPSSRLLVKWAIVVVSLVTRAMSIAQLCLIDGFAFDLAFICSIARGGLDSFCRRDGRCRQVGRT